MCGVVCLLAVARAEAAAQVETVVVTASALPGTALDPDQIPASVQTLSSADLTRLGAASTLRSLNDQASGVSLSDAQDNPFQPNLFYRGFEASPLAGDSQGLAVYLDGVRLNQPFGDVVNWDLIPDIAIDRLTLEGSNPVFGLNALGGSVSVAMKNGFGWQGTEAEAEGGSFGRAQGSLQFGEDDGATSVYAAAHRAERRWLARTFAVASRAGLHRFRLARQRRGTPSGCRCCGERPDGQWHHPGAASRRGSRRGVHLSRQDGQPLRPGESVRLRRVGPGAVPAGQCLSQPLPPKHRERRFRAMQARAPAGCCASTTAPSSPMRAANRSPIFSTGAPTASST